MGTQVIAGVEVSEYSKKFLERGANPSNRGAFFGEEAAERGLALVEAKNADIRLYWLVNPVSDIIEGAKFFAYGGNESNAIADTLCAIVRGLTIDAATALCGMDVDAALRDNPVVSPVPEGKRPVFIVVDELLKSAKAAYPAAKGAALAIIAARNVAPKSSGPSAWTTEAEREWLTLSKKDQIARIEAVLDQDIRDYLHNEGGDIFVRDVIEGRRVLVNYEGLCGSCASSTGMTLAFIEDSLRTRLYEGLTVDPV
ncbi:MAG: iron-sulfur cluster assembly scaffold protein [Nitrospinae bacterium]|nr:iron-sulfur cluster assembly scaffold protein [Nitrospinota bacterium]